jgi:16S rRNA (guanine527-N7)-methyltransferase
MDLILKHFNRLSNKQKEQFEALLSLYGEWNSKINLISRKDMDHFYERHVLHSMAIAKFMRPTNGIKIMDAGTGGGFPGIPLAILFPEASFLLVDSIGKKIKVVESIAESLELNNVKAIQQRIEQVEGRFDFIISRAVTALPDFVQWTEGKIDGNSKCNKSNGIIYLKGGDLEAEIKLTPKHKTVKAYPLSAWFEEPFFDTKKLLHVY